MLASFAPVWEAVNENLENSGSVVRGILHSSDIPDPDILVFPEAFATGVSMDESMSSPAVSGQILAWMKEVSRLASCAVAGSVIVTEKGRRYNRFYFVEPSGAVSAYDKRHLYFGQESMNFTPGASVRLFSYKGWKIMPGICFDMRFPIWSRNTPDDPYDLYLNVANWPASRRSAADILLKARAIENVSYAAICTRSGSDPLMAYDGQSSVVNHRGRVRSHTCDIQGTPVCFAVLDKSELVRYRQAFPALNQRD